MPIWLMQDGDRLTSPPPKQGVVGVNTTVDILFANSFVKMASGLLIPTLAAAPGTTPKVWPYSLASSIAGVLGGVNVISGGTNRGAGNALGIKFAEPGGVSYSAFSAGDAIEYKPDPGKNATSTPKGPPAGIQGLSGAGKPPSPQDPLQAKIAALYKQWQGP